MRDIIDERNEKERVKRSIIKFWNVNYVPVSAQNHKVQENQGREEEFIDAERLAAISEEFYNSTTKSYSGAYGAEGVKDEVTKGQVDKILHEKDEKLRLLFNEVPKNSGEEL